MNANIPPTTPHLYARTTKYAYIIIYIYQRETEGSYVFRGTPSLSPIYIYHISYIIYIYIISAVIYGFFRPSVLDLAGSSFRRTEGIEGTEGTWVSGRQGATRHIPPQHQTWHGLFWGLTWGQGVGGTDRGLGNTTWFLLWRQSTLRYPLCKRGPFVRDFLQEWKLEASKHLFRARVPPRMEDGSFKRYLD